MLLVYENRTDGIVVEWKKTVHFPPHLHEAIPCFPGLCLFLCGSGFRFFRSRQDGKDAV